MSGPWAELVIWEDEASLLVLWKAEGENTGWGGVDEGRCLMEKMSAHRRKRGRSCGWYGYGVVAICREMVVDVGRRARKWEPAFGGGDIWKSDHMALAWQD